MFGGYLIQFVKKQRALTTDKWVLEVIHGGYLIKCLTAPSHKPPSWIILRDHSHKEILWQEVNTLLLWGAIGKVPVPHHGKGFYSPFFLIAMKSAGWRLVLDLCELNKFIRKLKFCTICLASIIPSLDGRAHGLWLATADRRFLRFLFDQDYYQFKVLSFSLATAPRVFPKVFSVVAAWVRREGSSHTLMTNVSQAAPTRSSTGQPVFGSAFYVPQVSALITNNPHLSQRGA